MAIRSGRLLLTAALGLSVVGWFVETLSSQASLLGEGLVGVAIAGGWILLSQRQRMGNAPVTVPLFLNRTALDQSLGEVKAIVMTLRQEVETLENNASSFEAQISQIQQQVLALETRERQGLRVALVGGQAVGKSTLRQQLQEAVFDQPLDVRDSDPALVTPIADLQLLVTTGDLTDSERQVLQEYVAQQQRVVLVLNKQDQYLSQERDLLIRQLQRHTQDWLASEDVVAIAAAPNPVRVRQHQTDSFVQEWLEVPEPDCQALIERLNQILSHEGEFLRLATACREAIALKTEAQSLLNQVRRSRALPVIERYQWLAAIAAFTNPIPTLDLLATAAINTQMVFDLGAIYQQQFSLPQAQTLTQSLANLLVKLGLVEFSSQAIGLVLKGHAFTYVAGGAVQGVSAAYLTRIGGLSLVEFFEEQSLHPASTTSANWLERLRFSLERIVKENQRTEFIQSFVGQALGRLSQGNQAQKAMT